MSRLKGAVSATAVVAIAAALVGAAGSGAVAAPAATAPTPVSAETPSTANPAFSPKIVRDPDGVPTVAGYDVADFGADPSGRTDARAALQSALDAAGAQGGGVVWAGAGRYLLTGTLSIPKGVTLLGAWSDPDGKSGRPTKNGKDRPGGQDTAKLTTLLAEPASGTDEPLVTVVGGGGLQGITVYYPDQKASAPVPYGPTVRLGGNGSQFAGLKQVTLVNSYEAIRAGTDNNELGVLDQVRATALNKGVTIDFATDVGRIEDLEISPRYWARYDGTNAATVAAYTRANLVGLDIGRSDTQYLKGYSIESAQLGLRLRTDRGVTGDVTVSSSGQYSDVRMDDVATGVQLDDVNSIAVQLTHAAINATAVGIGTGPKFSRTTFNCTDCSLDVPDGRAVSIAAGATGIVGLYDSAVARSAGAAIVLEGGSVQVQHTTVGRTRGAATVAAGAGAGAIDLISTGLAASDVSRASGSTALTIENAPKTTGAAPEAPDLPAEPTVRGTTLTVVTTAPYSADATGVTDATTPIQAALDATARRGGGITYLPAGRYRVDGSLTVPSGVELRGAQIGPFHTNAAATVLYVLGNAGNESAVATISLSKNSGLTGLLTWYPEQSAQAPVAYPYAVRALGKNTWVRAFDMGNAWQGLDLSTGDSTGHSVDWIVGSPLKNGIAVGGSSEGVIRRAHFNPHFWFRTTGTTLPGAPADYDAMIALFFRIMKVQDTTLESFRLGTAKNEIIDQSFAYRSKVGAHLLGQNGTGFEGLLYGFWIDASVDSFLIDSTGRHGFDCVNCDSGAVPWGFDATQGTIPDPPTDGLSESYIRLEPSAGDRSEARFHNYSANAFNWNPHRGVVVQSGKLVLAQAAFTASARDDAGTLDLRAGSTDAQGLTFNRVGRIDATGLGFAEQPVWTDVVVHPGVKRATVIGVVARVGWRTSTPSASPAIVVRGVAVAPQ